MEMTLQLLAPHESKLWNHISSLFRWCGGDGPVDAYRLLETHRSPTDSDWVLIWTACGLAAPHGVPGIPLQHTEREHWPPNGVVEWVKTLSEATGHPVALHFQWIVGNNVEDEWAVMYESGNVCTFEMNCGVQLKDSIVTEIRAGIAIRYLGQTVLDVIVSRLSGKMKGK